MTLPQPEGCGHHLLVFLTDFWQIHETKQEKREKETIDALIKTHSTYKFATWEKVDPKLHEEPVLLRVGELQSLTAPSPANPCNVMGNHTPLRYSSSCVNTDWKGLL